MWLIFALSLLIRLAYNLFQPSTALFACDGFEYLTDAQALLVFIQKESGFQFLHNLSIVGFGFQSLHDLSIAGPVFPLFIICSYLLFGQTPALDHAIPLLVTQSLISALTTVFIVVIARFCWNRTVSNIAGLIAAFYPAFIINSGRLYTETLATFLLSGLLLLTCKIISSRPNLILCTTAGLTAAALQLTRSSMVIVSFVSIFFTALFFYLTKGPLSALKVITTSALGFMLLIVPWLCFSHLAFGTASMILDRNGHFNFFVGNYIDTWGWLSVPCPKLTGIDHCGMLQLLRCAIHRDPGQWCRLLLDKAHRLFDFPWNDFHSNLGPIDFHLQILFHQALLLLAAIGIGLSLFTRHLGDDSMHYSRQFLCRFFLLFVLALHLLYMFFITMPRYNLSVMPIIIMFAGVGLVQILRLLSAEDMRKQATYLAAIALALFLIAHLPLQLFSQLTTLNKAPVSAVILLSIIKAITCIAFFYVVWRTAVNEFAHDLPGDRRIITTAAAALALIVTIVITTPARAEGRPFEWQLTLKSPDSTLTTCIRLPAVLQNEPRSRACYLLIDSNGVQQIQRDAVVSVNGQQLTGPFVPGLSLMDNISNFQAFDLHQLYLECGYIFNCLSSPSNIANIDLRQWVVIPIPQAVIESASKQGLMQIEIKPATTTSLQIFAQRLVGKHILMPSPYKCSWEKAFFGVENDLKFSDPRYDLKLSSTAQDGALIPDVLLLTDKKSHGIAPPITISPVVDHQNSPNLSISASSIPLYGKSNFWIIRISGQVRSPESLPNLRALRNQTTFTTAVSVVSRSLPSQEPVALRLASNEWANPGRPYGAIKVAQTFTYKPPWTPHIFTMRTEGIPFEIAFPLIPSAMPGTVKSINLSINSANAPLELSNCKIEIYELPSHPLGYTMHVHVPEQLSVVASRE